MLESAFVTGIKDWPSGFGPLSNPDVGLRIRTVSSQIAF